MFEIDECRLDAPGLSLRYHRVPWDEKIVGAPVAAISAIDVRDSAAGSEAWSSFADWCRSERVALVSCRLAQDKLAECGFLEARGFRFIELNYRPRLAGLAQHELGSADDVRIDTALPADAPAIAEIAAQVFDTGRFHVDPLVGPEIGNRRYRAWAANAFDNPAQSVLACLMADRLVGFFVVESPADKVRFWSLIGLAPGWGGRGLGRKVGRAVLRKHREEDVDEVSTSMSSHNVAAMKLYASLGFRFPSPFITLHWCPFGAVR